MDDVTLWCGFLSAWLLVAGPLYQAALELQAEEDAAERMRSLKHLVEAPSSISPWWWLLPPVHVHLNHQRRVRHRNLMLGAMTEEDYEVLSHYMNKALGWMLVGIGGLLLGLKETWELTDHFGGGVLVFVAVLVLMIIVVVGNVATRQRQSRRSTALRAKVGGDADR